MRTINALACLFLLMSFAMCNTKPTKPPERHSSIPKEAEWYGGADGGAWILVDEGDSVNIFKVKVYNENDGSLWTDGFFTISENCSDTILTVEEVQKSIDFYSGEDIGLLTVRKGKHCALIPIK